MTDTVVAEGQVKLKDGKKWKTRWVVLRKPSPVADCLFLLAFKKEKKKKRGAGQQERLSLTLEGICGVEPACGFDGVPYSLSVLCLSHTLVLGFSSRDTLQTWDARIRFHLGEVHRFSVSVEPGAKLESGPASLHLCNSLLVLTRGLPPAVTGHWKLSALRRYGAVPNGFVFEGGTRCGYWAGVFYLSCSEGDQISFLVDCIVRGVAPSRPAQGLCPALSDASPVTAEERILQETSELEKRLSRLSNCSLASSTASTFSCSTSVAGDDHSSISSSSSSQSDASYGPRLPFWPEPLSRLHPSNDAVSSCSTLKALTSSDDRLYAAATASAGTRPSSAQLHPRGLHDSGRQSSLDSGIGIAPGSQSSGSFSSYTGSLDAAIAPGAEEFGSAPSLVLPQSTATPLVPPPPPAEASPTPITPISSSASSSCSSSRCSTRTSQRDSSEYHVPSVLSLRYDTPKSLLQSLTFRETPHPPSEPSRDSPASGSHWWVGGPPKVIEKHTNLWGMKEGPTPRPQSVPACLIHGKTQCSHASDNYITPEQWRAAGNSATKKVEESAPEQAFRTKPDEQNTLGALGQMLSRLRLSVPSSPPPAPLAAPARPATARPATACGLFRPDSRAAPSTFLDPGLYLHNTVHYVNVPCALMAKGNRDLLYSELLRSNPAALSNLQAALRIPPPPVEGSPGAFTHLSPGAMATAQMGARSAQGRPWDRPTQTRRPGTPP